MAGLGQNSNVWKNKVTIPMFGRYSQNSAIRGIKSEFACLERYTQNSNVWKEKKTIQRFKRIRPEFQCLEG